MSKTNKNFALAIICGSLVILAGLLEAGESVSRGAPVVPVVLSAVLMLAGFAIVLAAVWFR